MHLHANEAARATRVGWLTVVVGAMLFVAGTAGHRPIFVLVVLTTMNVCSGLMQPLTQSWFNQQIGSDERATLLSFNSTFATAGGSMGLLVNGMIADARGISTAWQFSAILSLAAFPCYWALRPHPAAHASTLTQVSS
jgi:predicted MFS family arabinose efflux permease